MQLDWNLLLGKLIENLPAIAAAVFSGIASIVGALALWKSAQAKWQSEANAEHITTAIKTSSTENAEIKSEVKGLGEKINGNVETLMETVATAAEARGTLAEKERGDETARVLAKKVEDDKPKA